MKKFFIIGIVIIIAVAMAITFYSPLNNKFNQLFFATKIYTLLNTEEVMNLHQVITQNSTNSRTIMWQSLSDRDDFILEYGTDKNENNLTTVKPTKKLLDVDEKQIYVYSVTLNNLTENTLYNYRVGYGDKRIEWETLHTADSKSQKFKVLIFPDSQSNDYTDWNNLAQMAWQNNPDAQFFINMGDLVDNGYDLSQWNDWFGGVDGMINKIPVAPVMGNHETYTTDWEVAMPLPYLNFFDLPPADKTEYQNIYYSYDYGNVHFSVLNTQDDEMKDTLPNLVADQLAWLEQDLANADARGMKWKIVLFHRDVLRYGRDAKPLGNEIEFTPQGNDFMPIFDKYDVDAVLTAHLHTYRRRAQIKNFLPTHQGTLYILTGVAGNVRYPSLWHEHPLDVYVPPQPESDNYIVMEADTNSLTFKAYFPDNSLMDSITLQK